MTKPKVDHVIRSIGFYTPAERRRFREALDRQDAIDSGAPLLRVVARSQQQQSVAALAVENDRLRSEIRNQSIDAREKIIESYKMGGRDAYDAVESFIFPLLQAISTTNNIVARLLGVVAAGRGELARQNIAKLAHDLGDALNDLDTAKRVYEIEFHNGAVTVLDGLAKTFEIKNAARDYGAGGSFDTLLDFIASLNEVEREYIKLRTLDGLRPGVAPQPGGRYDWLFQYAEDTRQSINGNWKDVVLLLRRQIDDPERKWTPDQRSQLEELRYDDNAHRRLSRGWHELKKARRKREKASVRWLNPGQHDSEMKVS